MAISHKFLCAVLLLSFSPEFFKLFLWLIFLLPMNSLQEYCLICKCLEFFRYVLLIFSLISLCVEIHFHVISILLNLLRLVSWPRIQSVLVNVPRALERNLYSAFVGKNALSLSVRLRWLIVLL